MTQKIKYLTWLLLVQCLLACVAAAPTTENPRGQNSHIIVASEQLEEEARVETEALLNSLFRAQIQYFNHIKTKLAPQTQRARDIVTYTSRLNEAIAVKDIGQKHGMWLQIFEDFSKSPLLLNNQTETGLSNEEYNALLSDSSLQEITTKFLADVANYFMKMAKASNKVVEVAIDHYIKNKRHTQFHFI